MADNPKKYKITDKEGADYFFDALYHKEEVKDDKQERDDRRKALRLKIGAYSAVGALFLIFGIYILLNIFSDMRQEGLEVNTILESTYKFRNSIKMSHANDISYEREIEFADSLIEELVKLHKKYPDKDTLGSAINILSVQKFEKVIFKAVKNNQFDEIPEPDSLTTYYLNTSGQEFKPVIPVLQSLIDFHKFWELYPNPPELCEAAPKKWQIEKLSEDSKMIVEILDTTGALIEVNFPELYTWLKHISNTLFPEISQWAYFWKNYEGILTDGKISADEQKQYSELMQEFPTLTILHESNGNILNNQVSLVLGITESSILPPGRSYENELAPIGEYIFNKTGIKVEFKLYEKYSDMLFDFNNSNIDLVILDLPSSTISYYSRIGIPLAQRLWGEYTLVEYNIVSDNPGITSYDKIKDRDINFIENDEFLLFSYLENSKYKDEVFQADLVKFKNLDSLADIYQKRANKEISILSDEAVSYLKLDNNYSPRNIPIQYLGKYPLSVLWAKESIQAQVLTKLASVIISMSSKELYSHLNKPTERPYSSWGFYEPDMMKSHYSDIRDVLIKYNKILNRLHLLPVDVDTDLSKEPLKDAISSFFEKIGFSVIPDNEKESSYLKDKKHTLTIKATRSSDDRVEYHLNIHEVHKSGKKNLLYDGKFSQSKDNYPPNLKNKIFDVQNYIPILGEISEFKGDNAILKSSVIPDHLLNKTVYLFKTDSFGKIKTDYYGKAKVVAINGSKIEIKLDKDALKQVRIGDIGELKD